MTAHPPSCIQNYFFGKNARDFDLAVSGFASSAVVKDERRDFEGPNAIRAWIEETAAKYDDRSEIKNMTADGSNVEVAAEVSGAFPGSPILLRFRFTLDGDRIIRLEIAP